MKIRELGQEEWQKLRDLYLALLKSDPEAFVDEYDEVSSRTEEEWLANLSREGATFVAEDEDKLIGMGRINFYKEVPGVPVLHKLGVLPAYRNRGIAKQLVLAREKWARKHGADKVRTYVLAERAKTIEFSIKNGYKQTELLKDNVEKSDDSTPDVVVMEKGL